VADRSIKIQFFPPEECPLPQGYPGLSFRRARARTQGHARLVGVHKDSRAKGQSPQCATARRRAAKTRKKRPRPSRQGRDIGGEGGVGEGEGERTAAVSLWTDSGRCNFREDPLRRWAQLVGALTRPLSRRGALPRRRRPPPPLFSRCSVPLSLPSLPSRSPVALPVRARAILLANLICPFSRPVPETSVNAGGEEEEGGFQDGLSGERRVTGYPREPHRVSLRALYAGVTRHAACGRVGAGSVRLHSTLSPGRQAVILSVYPIVSAPLRRGPRRTLLLLLLLLMRRPTRRAIGR